MNPLWKTRLATLGAGLLAVVVGWSLAHGDFALPALAGGIGAAACLVALTGVRFDTLVLGGLLFGYIVGNRGFAQFSLVPGLPLLPAETGLAVCAGWLVVAAAFGRHLPLQRDALNYVVALWIGLGAARIYSDVQTHGFVALRDFAMIYYAAFFFIAQAQAARDTTRRFLENCLLAAVVIVIPLFELFRRFPEFFLGTLVVGGIPVIFFKGDLVATFMAVGVVLAHLRWENTRRVAWLLVALFGLLGVLLSENRASLLGLLIVTGWLAVAQRWALLRTQLAALALVGIALLGGAAVGAVGPRENAALPVYERVASIFDFDGTRAYFSSEAEFKGDNNRFRLVWWRTVFDETLAGNPWLGLGFGHDLAAGFLRQYYPDNLEEFTTRSPHNILLTIFGRTGVLGLVVFLAVPFVMARRTFRALRQTRCDPARVGSWLTAWLILVCACFGVVLEGPMGAVVFWTSLGLANVANPDVSASTETPAAEAPLPAPVPAADTPLPLP